MNTVAEEILKELENQFRDLKANDGSLLFRQMRDYIITKFLLNEETDYETSSIKQTDAPKL